MNDSTPKLALGAWSWGVGNAGGDAVFGNHLSAEDLKPVFYKALECGLNLWDTAPVYGDGSSESILGGFIREVDRRDIIISTKFTPHIAGDSPNAAREMLEGSLGRLNTEYVDIYWIHNPNDVERWTPMLIPLAKEGVIKSIGVSNHNLSEIKRVREILGAEGLRLSAVQNHYSLLHRSSERAGILDYCKENGITFYSYMVLEQGALTGRFDRAHPFPEGSSRAKTYNGILSELETLIAEMRRVGERYGASPAQIAIAWARSKGTLPIIGVTKVSQAEEASRTAEIVLSAEEISVLEEFADKTGVSTLRGWEREM
ncbi:MAG: aldo/keto reductase [Ruminococcaceae bacterium]|nr:aldo/keto reductase [Oscillospiraceae bacterium]